MDSKPMKWSELRERVLQAADGGKGIAKLLADIDAAAPAMERQALCVTEYYDIIRDVRTLNKRRCWDCGLEGWHADSVAPYVACSQCKSMDTRRITPT